MASSLLRSFLRRRAQRKVMSKMTENWEEYDKMIASAIEATEKFASQLDVSDKYFSIVARSGWGNNTIKVKRASDVKGGMRVFAALGRADAAVAGANDALAGANASLARAKAANARGYAAADVVGAATQLTFGLGFSV